MLRAVDAVAGAGEVATVVVARVVVVVGAVVAAVVVAPGVPAGVGVQDVGLGQQPLGKAGGCQVRTPILCHGGWFGGVCGASSRAWRFSGIEHLGVGVVWPWRSLGSAHWGEDVCRSRR